MRLRSLVVCAFIILSPGVAADDKPPWDTECRQSQRKADPDCEMTQMVVVRDTGQVLLRVTVRVPGNGAGPAMMLHLPHGLYLPDGVRLAVDGTAWQAVAVQTCDAKGCYAGLDLGEDGLDRLRRGKELRIVYTALSRTEVPVPVSLMGFRRSFERIR